MGGEDDLAGAGSVGGDFGGEGEFASAHEAVAVGQEGQGALGGGEGGGVGPVVGFE